MESTYDINIFIKKYNVPARYTNMINLQITFVNIESFRIRIQKALVRPKMVKAMIERGIKKITNNIKLSSNTTPAFDTACLLHPHPSNSPYSVR